MLGEIDPEEPDETGEMDTISYMRLSEDEETSEESATEVYTERDLSQVPEKYRDLPIVKNPPQKYLNEHSILDLCLDLTDEKAFWQAPMIPLSYEKQKFANNKIEEMLRKGYIEKSTSPRYCNMFLVPKKGTERYRMVINYKPLNAVTKDFIYPLPSYKEIVTKLTGNHIFTRLDLQNAYHLLRIRKGDEEKTAFVANSGIYQFKVVPFGLKNAPTYFTRFITTILREFLNRCSIVYMDDILIYSQEIKQHEKEVHAVLQRLGEARLQLNVAKCEFNTKELKFIGVIFSENEMKPDPERIEAILQWKRSKNLRQLRGFIGYVNYIREFLPHISKIARPLYALLSKGVRYTWGTAQEDAFIKTKNAATNAQFLHYFVPGAKTRLETDASNYAIGAMIVQRIDGKYRPIAFYSHLLNTTQQNW